MTVKVAVEVEPEVEWAVDVEEVEAVVEATDLKYPLLQTKIEKSNTLLLQTRAARDP